MSPSAAGPNESDAPRYALAWAALLYVLLTLVLGYPALTGGFLVTPPSDQYIGGFPVRDFAAQSLKAGLGIPLWNPYIFGGMPYVAAMGVGDIFYPTFLLRMLLPVDVGMTLGFMIHVFMAGLFMYVFCRAMGLSYIASLIGGAAYMMCGPTAGLVSPGHDGKLFVAALTPLALVQMLRWVRDGKVWALGAFSITIGLMVLSPHPQVLQYALLLCGFFGLYFAFGWGGDSLPAKLGVQRLAFALIAVAIGFGIGAIQYAPFIQYVPFSPRADGIEGGYRAATSFSLPPEELLNAYLPEFSGMLSKYWGRNGIHHHSDYFGVIGLMLASLAIGAKGKGVAFTRSFKLFVLGVLIVATVWAMGAFTPFYRIIYAVVPGTKFFRAPSAIMFIMAFAVAVFAAIGAQRALTGDVKRPWMIAWGIGAVVILLLAVSGALTNFGSAIIEMMYRPANQPARLDAALQEVTANAGAVAFGGVRSLIFALAGIVICVGIAQRRISGRAAAYGVLAALVIDFWTVERKYWGFSGRASVLYRSDATIDYLKAHKDSGRVISAIISSNVAYHDVMLNGDGLMVHEVRQAAGYHGNALGRYEKLFDPDASQTISNPAMRALGNVRYLMTNEPLPDSTVRGLFGAAGRLVAGPARNAPGTMVYLYDMGPSDAAWVATSALKVPDDRALPTLRDPRFNAAAQRSVALLDSASPSKALPSLTVMPSPSMLTARVQRPTHSKITIDLSGPAQDGNVLVVSENFYPGWRAVVDGKPATAERADYSLIGVPLAGGARKVELEFTSPMSSMGKAITFASLLLSALIIGAGLMPKRGGAAPGAA